MDTHFSSFQALAEAIFQGDQQLITPPKPVIKILSAPEKPKLNFTPPVVNYAKFHARMAKYPALSAKLTRPTYEPLDLFLDDTSCNHTQALMRVLCPDGSAKIKCLDCGKIVKRGMVCQTNSDFIGGTTHIFTRRLVAVDTPRNMNKAERAAYRRSNRECYTNET